MEHLVYSLAQGIMVSGHDPQKKVAEELPSKRSTKQLSYCTKVEDGHDVHFSSMVGNHLPVSMIDIGLCSVIMSGLVRNKGHKFEQ